MRCRVLVGITLLLWVYVLVGGAVFHLLESKHEDETINDTLDAFYDLLQNNTCVSREELEFVLRVAYDAFRDGIYLDDLDETPTHQWAYGRAVFFCTTVVTTIGFGHLAPSTSAGRVFCVIYALVGIPLCLVVISALGRQLSEASQRLCNRAAWCRHRKWLPLLAHMLFGSVLFIWLAAAMFGHVEKWGYGDSAYFTFITLSTIGFGDFIPVGGDLVGTNKLPYQFVNTLWILGGLSWLSLIISSLQTALEDKLSSKVDPPDSQAEKNGHASQETLAVRGNQVMEMSACPERNSRSEDL